MLLKPLQRLGLRDLFARVLARPPDGVHLGEKLLSEPGDKRAVGDRLQVDAPVAVPLQLDDDQFPAGR